MDDATVSKYHQSLNDKSEHAVSSAFRAKINIARSLKQEKGFTKDK